MSSKQKKLIAIYFWESWLSIAPTIINIAEAFSEKKHQVIIFMRDIKANYAPDTQLRENISVVKLSPQKSFADRYLERLLKFCPAKYRLFLYNRITLNNACLQSKRYLVQQNKLNVLHIGVDATGLYWAHKSSGKHEKLIYLSLELLCKKDVAHYDLYSQWIKNKEILLHKHNTIVTLIQDSYRMKVLQKENKINSEKQFFILTNSPRKITSAYKTNENYFKELFKLPGDNKIILMAGMIDSITMAVEVSRSFNKVKNKKINLVFHERETRAQEEPFLREVKAVGGNNVHLSLSPLPYSEIHRVYSSSDIGLAFYRPGLADNITNIIGASGKLSHYLMYGIPVIANNLPGFRDLFKKYEIGVVIESMDELEEAICKIFSKYEIYTRNAQNCYLKEYDFDLQFNNFYNAFHNNFN